MNTPLTPEQEKDIALHWAITSTILYVLLLYPFLMLAFFGMVVLHSSGNISEAVNWGVFFVNSLAPSSIPYAITFIWIGYAKRNYRQSRQSCYAPMKILGAALSLNLLVYGIEFFIK